MITTRTGPQDEPQEELQEEPQNCAGCPRCWPAKGDGPWAERNRTRPAHAAGMQKGQPTIDTWHSGANRWRA
jgi:hypothetical protein